MQTVASLSARSAVVQTQLGSRRVATSRTVRRAAAVPMAAAKSFYELSATDIDGNDVSVFLVIELFAHTNFVFSGVRSCRSRLSLREKPRVPGRFSVSSF